MAFSIRTEEFLLDQKIVVDTSCVHRRTAAQCSTGSLCAGDQQHRLRDDVPRRRLHRAHPGDLHLRRLEEGWIRLMRGTSCYMPT